MTTTITLPREVAQSARDMLNRAYGRSGDVHPVITALDAALAAPAEPEPSPLYYMRDNHTFLRLSEDVEEALRQISKEWEAGYTCGILSTDRPDTPDVVHANGTGTWPLFVQQARAWFATVPDDAAIDAAIAAGKPHD